MINHEKQEQKERDPSVLEMRGYLAENLPLIEMEGFDPEQITNDQLLRLYVFMRNRTAPTIDGFSEYLEKVYGKNVPLNDLEQDKKMKNAFRLFLWEKLPLELQHKQEQISEERGESEIPLERLIKLHEKRKEMGDATIVGFHVGPEQRTGKIHFGGGVHEVRSASGAEEMSGGSFYATNPEHLYGQKGGALYIVEGFDRDLKTSYAKAKEGQGWAAAKGDLYVLNDGNPIPITDELVSEFGLRFEQ